MHDRSIAKNMLFSRVLAENHKEDYPPTIAATMKNYEIEFHNLEKLKFLMNQFEF
jgi:hypothetical protein